MNNSWQGLSWKLKAPYIFQAMGPNLVKVAGFIGTLWWRRKVEGQLKYSEALNGYFWASNGVGLKLAPEHIWRSLEHARLLADRG